MRSDNDLLSELCGTLRLGKNSSFTMGRMQRYNCVHNLTSQCSSNVRKCSSSIIRHHTELPSAFSYRPPTLSSRDRFIPFCPQHVHFKTLNVLDHWTYASLLLPFCQVQGGRGTEDEINASQPASVSVVG